MIKQWCQVHVTLDPTLKQSAAPHPSNAHLADMVRSTHMEAHVAKGHATDVKLRMTAAAASRSAASGTGSPSDRALASHLTNPAAKDSGPPAMLLLLHCTACCSCLHNGLLSADWQTCVGRQRCGSMQACQTRLATST